MRAVWVVLLVACAHGQQGGESACWQAADAGEFPLPADLAAELAQAHQGRCAAVPDAGTYAWYEDCASRFRDYMGGYCGTAVKDWCNSHCGSKNCGSDLNKQGVTKICAAGMLPGFLSSLRYCSGLNLKTNESYLAEPDGGHPTCP